MIDFLQTSNKLSSKKKRQINKNKWKVSIKKTSLKKAIINSLESSNKTSKPKAKNIDIAIICTDAYYAACYFPET